MKKLISYVVVFLGVIGIFQYIFFLGYIPSESMEPTLNTGDLVVGTRFNVEDVQRYDVAVFKYPDDESRYFIKRVIGLPGEYIDNRNGVVYANGVELVASFIKELSNETVSYHVPEDSYFMLGDNRNASLDSRYWENTYVHSDQMVAIAQFRLFPLFPKGL